jgi:hypothetical protein
MKIRPRLAQAYCLASFAVLAVNYYLQPPVSYGLTGAGVAVITTTWLWMVLAVIARPRRRNLTWALLTAGSGCFVIAALINFGYQSIDGSFPFPGPADVPFLLVYPVAGAGLALFSRQGSDGGHGMEVAGSAVLIAAVAAQVFTWPSVWVPLSDLPVPLLTKAVTLAYPAGDFILLAVAVAVFLAMRSGEPLPGVTPGRPQVSRAELWLVIGGITGLLAADTAFNYVSLRWRWDQPSVIDAGWFALFLLWSLAALEPAREE